LEISDISIGLGIYPKIKDEFLVVPGFFQFKWFASLLQEVLKQTFCSRQGFEVTRLNYFSGIKD
jgi:hypothetical protein